MSASAEPVVPECSKPRFTFREYKIQCRFQADPVAASASNVATTLPRQEPMTLGIIGVGTIAAAVVEGLQSTTARCPVVLSPRNERRASLLASKFAEVQCAPPNQWDSE